eukprot:gnl/Spiro4/29225_TR14295_c0_g1_i1.p1 gnl/Spiro4/29225_TR14295_c0_g1~~gnl/Spiro4/29225_TR14295_c0_g1_i1.p1  ORF type:complete len:220 (-),score=31.19 gnl/Spiro4/29225_TR14295_c0_g1_i1:92-751(-)
MAWRCSGPTNFHLVENLFRSGIIRTDRVRTAMMGVDRACFTRVNPYEDRPQGIDYGATISAPHMHAHALEYLQDHLVDGAHALDVGVGSGYLAACMAQLVGSTGLVVGIDYIPELVSLARDNLRRAHGALLDSGRVVLRVGDGWQGVAEHAPYNAIHVGAAAVVVPDALLAQLAPGGRMIIPVGPDGGDQCLVQIDKDSRGVATRKNLMGVRYVPLVRR